MTPTRLPLVSLQDQFHALFGRDATSHAQASGRVNLIGEHTDYNGGLVLPVAIPQHATVLVAPREDDQVRAASQNVDAGTSQTFSLSETCRRNDWTDYLQGAAQSLLAKHYPLRGFDVLVASDVPLGSGLSSSAALLVALLRALRTTFSLPFDDVVLAALGQHAENDFVGAPVGIMDFMAASLGDQQHALLVDTDKLAYRRIPLPSTADLLVIDSGIAHQHATGAYRKRREECEQAAALLDVPWLCQLPAERQSAWASLPPPLDRRARHVITENERVIAAVTALEAGDWPALGLLLNASHASLRDDYEVSLPLIDRLVELAQSNDHVYGARLTGGGFGGSFVAIVERDTAQEVGRWIVDAFYDDCKTTQGGPHIVVPAQFFGDVSS